MGTNTSNDRKWHEMSATEKVVWCGKLIVALCTFGFAFPRVMDPHLQD
jgi:hypothetical protein